MDDSFSWADTVDVWNGVEGLPEENTEQSEKVLKKKQRRKESVEDHLNEGRGRAIPCARTRSRSG